MLEVPKFNRETQEKLNHVVKGQRPSATQQNKLIDIANERPEIYDVLDGPNSPKLTGLVVMKGLNTTKERFELFDVILLRGINEQVNIYTNFNREFVFRMDAIGEEEDEDEDSPANFAVCQQPIDPGWVGPIAVAGYTLARVSGSSSNDLPTAGIKGGNGNVLTMNWGSIRVIWHQGGLGLVCLGLGSDPSQYLIARWQAYEGR